MCFYIYSNNVLHFIEIVTEAMQKGCWRFLLNHEADTTQKIRDDRRTTVILWKFSDCQPGENSSGDMEIE